ncbi:HD domain-containing protein [Carboxydothermus islandicus]|uniref:HD domain-containing protein n=1 Tax=Carboxydothermus islandicus TaxID=661089 RepID=UPI00096A4F5E|nr:HD domain-containing protein [Carboxydothermus islandicus]
MQRFWRVFRDEEVVRRFREINYLERDREFCRHDFQHFLDVARILAILCFENKFSFPRELIYITALLHDLGRVEEYLYGLNHALIGAEVAREILEKYREFGREEIFRITEAIRGHREQNSEGFTHLLYLADKLSRPCLACGVIDNCWKKEEMLILHREKFY